MGQSEGHSWQHRLHKGSSPAGVLGCRKFVRKKTIGISTALAYSTRTILVLTVGPSSFTVFSSTVTPHVSFFGNLPWIQKGLNTSFETEKGKKRQTKARVAIIINNYGADYATEAPELGCRGGEFVRTEMNRVVYETVYSMMMRVPLL